MISAQISHLYSNRLTYQVSAKPVAINRGASGTTSRNSPSTSHSNSSINLVALNEKSATSSSRLTVWITGLRGTSFVFIISYKGVIEQEGGSRSEGAEELWLRSLAEQITTLFLHRRSFPFFVCSFFHTLHLAELCMIFNQLSFFLLSLLV